MSWLRANWPGLALAAVVSIAALAASSRVVGLAWDDGVYVAAGQALAHGKGYVLANRVGLQPVPGYPPGYPLICALVWLVCGSTSRVLAALAALSAACMSVASLLWYRVLRREQAAEIAALLVAVPALSYAALSVAEERMADAPYALLVAVAAALWGRARSSTWSTTAIVLLAAVAPLLRTAGAVLTIALILLLASRRRWLAACGALAAALALQLAVRVALRAPEPSYVELTSAAWGDGGAGASILFRALTRGLWESIASFAVPPVFYSGAIQRAVREGGVAAVGYGMFVAAIAGAALLGAWRRLRADRWGVGDLALVGAMSLIFVTPFGMMPRFLVPFGPVIAMWAWTGLGGQGRRSRWVLGSLLSLVLLGTLAQAAQHARRKPVLVRERSAAYLAAADSAHRRLGQDGIVVAEFPETVWFGRRLKTVSSPTMFENVLDAETAFARIRRQVETIGRGCLLDTKTFPVSRRLFELLAGRPGAERLEGLDARYVRAVCWGAGAG